MINREDMLELTRRMIPSRHVFDRVAGAYMDNEGFIDGKLFPFYSPHAIMLMWGIKLGKRSGYGYKVNCGGSVCL